MNKEEFLTALKEGLKGLPQDEVDGRLSFYGEMIDDRMEEGLSEEEAVAAAGNIGEIVAQTLSEIPLSKLVKEKIKPKRTLRGWEIALIILGFPLWFPLLLAAGAVLLSLYVVVWALIISLWAIEASLWACALGGLALSAAYAIHGNLFLCLFSAGVGLFCAGVSVFMFFGCLAASKGILRLTKKAALGIKKLFMKKESDK